MRVGLIGYGYWGPNLMRNLAEIDGVELRWCADQRADRRALAKRRYPLVNVTENAEEVFADDTVDAVVIATPVFSHSRGRSRRARSSAPWPRRMGSS